MLSESIPFHGCLTKYAAVCRCDGNKIWICLHPNYLCDGVHHCPRHDDELLCDSATCPGHCTCHGLAFTCRQPFPAHKHLDLRYLHARHSNITVEDIAENTVLVYLNLADCWIVSVGKVSLPNLKTLDLSDNKLSAIPYNMLDTSPHLRALFLSNNPLSKALQASHPPGTSTTVHVLSFSKIPLLTLNHELFHVFPEVRILNFSGCGIDSVTSGGFHSMKKLQTLDMKGCPLSRIEKHSLQDLNQLHTVYADTFTLCCTAALVENFDVKNCHVPKSEISSCTNLLRSDFYKVALVIFCILALAGNSVCSIFRVISSKRRNSQAFSIFVLHLCMSDFLMGVFLALIGIADWRYRDRYVWEDTAWRNSAECRLAGFLALLSCEVSAFLICLITIDRFLAVRFPLSFVHFSGFHAQLASGVSWATGLALATVPLLPPVAHWHFYGQTGICVPLPVVRRKFAGDSYSFAVMVIVNFVLFLVIVAGQAAIYMSIRANTLMGSRTSQHSQGMDIARRLFTIAVTDFLCWFPIGCLGLLASHGIPISDELNVAMAILVMPLNSSINPFLYTLNVILEKRRKRTEEQLIVKISSLQTQASLQLQPDRLLTR